MREMPLEYPKFEDEDAESTVNSLFANESDGYKTTNAPSSIWQLEWEFRSLTKKWPLTDS